VGPYFFNLNAGAFPLGMLLNATADCGDNESGDSRDELETLGEMFREPDDAGLE
jgi:hypothetical protein